MGCWIAFITSYIIKGPVSYIPKVTVCVLIFQLGKVNFYSKVNLWMKTLNSRDSQTGVREPLEVWEGTAGDLWVNENQLIIKIWNKKINHNTTLAKKNVVNCLLAHHTTPKHKSTVNIIKLTSSKYFSSGANKFFWGISSIQVFYIFLEFWSIIRGFPHNKGLNIKYFLTKKMLRSLHYHSTIKVIILVIHYSVFTDSHM